MLLRELSHAAIPRVSFAITPRAGGACWFGFRRWVRSMWLLSGRLMAMIPGVKSLVILMAWISCGCRLLHYSAGLWAVFMLCLVLCSCSGRRHDIIGVTDFKPAPTPLCVWVNGEPVFHLLERSTFPRLADSYPIRKGKNVLNVTGLAPDHVRLESIRGPVFFYSDGKNEDYLEPAKADDGSGFSAEFQAFRDYEIDGDVQRSEVTREIEEFSKVWVFEYLECLRTKDKTVLNDLFEMNPGGGRWLEDVEKFFRNEAQCVLPVSEKALMSKKGRSLVLVCGMTKLAEWKIGSVNWSFDSFLFCSCRDGLYLRVSCGKWVKVRLPQR